MIQFNLLPDIKLQMVKAIRLKRILFIVGGIASAACLTIVILIFLYVRVQKLQIDNYTNQLSSASSKLQGTANLNKILEVQNQVNSLPKLDAARPVVTRIPEFISQITPVQVTISTLNVVYVGTAGANDDDSMTITGQAPDLATVNEYVDTLTFATFQTSSKGSAINAFTNVLLSNFGYSSLNGATYTISATFNPDIFSQNYTVQTLTVPTEVTTRSELDQPQILFKPLPQPTGSTNNSSNSSNNTGSSNTTGSSTNSSNGNGQ